MKKALLLTIFIVFFNLLKAQPFEQIVDVDLKSGYNGFASWCDYNGDGLLDIFVTGTDFEGDYPHAMIYKNKGDNTFVESGIATLPKVIYGSHSWGDFDNNGTLDLIYAGTRSGFAEDNITKIMKNQGDTTFSQVPHAVPRLFSCYVEWVDVNNDGWLDIYYQGINDSNLFVLGLFKNTGQGSFVETEISISRIDGGRGNGTVNSAKWSDFDNDGLKDLLVAQSSNQSYKFELYKNEGNFKFQKIETGLPALNYVQLAVGDINNDGLNDITFTGTTRQTLYSADPYAHLYVFTNHGNMKFSESVKIRNTGVFHNTLDIGDINNDGYNDIVNYGAGSSYNLLKIFLNNKDNTFNALTHYIPESRSGGASLGDFDNDNDMDILYYGRMQDPFDVEVTYVYENLSDAKNKKPSPPESLFAWAVDNDIRFQWSSGVDDSTPSSAISYNLMIGTSPQNDSVLSAASLNGKLKAKSLGNTGFNREFLLKNPNQGQYYFKVQSIDNAYNASFYSDTSAFCFKKTSQYFTDTLDICAGDSIKVEMEGDFSAYKWNTGDTTPAIYIKKEGPYNLNITHNDGCVSSETLYLKIKGTSAISLGNDTTLCQGDTLQLKVDNNIDVMWSDHSTNNQFKVYKTGKYWVKAINIENCTLTDTIMVNFEPSPIVNLGPDTSITLNDTLVVFNLAHSTHILNYLWSNSSTNDSILIYGSDMPIGNYNYWIEATNEFGCTGSGTLTIHIKSSSSLFEKLVNLNVFPVPFNQHITINTHQELTGATTIRFYDTKGILLKNKTIYANSNKFTIDTKNLKRGYYLVSITNESLGLNHTVKLIK